MKKAIEFKIVDGCYICTSHCRNSAGYPQIHYNGHTTNMSRMIWEANKGVIPEGKVVCHHCDNPSCININHMFIGSQKENVEDCIRKGRDRKAKEFECNQCVISNQEVRAMRDYKEYFTPKELSKIFGVTPSHIRNILNNKKRKIMA